MKARFWWPLFASILAAPMAEACTNGLMALESRQQGQAQRPTVVICLEGRNSDRIPVQPVITFLRGQQNDQALNRALQTATGVGAGDFLRALEQYANEVEGGRRRDTIGFFATQPSDEPGWRGFVTSYNTVATGRPSPQPGSPAPVAQAPGGTPVPGQAPAQPAAAPAASSLNLLSETATHNARVLREQLVAACGAAQGPARQTAAQQLRFIHITYRSDNQTIRTVPIAFTSAQGGQGTVTMIGIGDNLAPVQRQVRSENGATIIKDGNGRDWNIDIRESLRVGASPAAGQPSPPTVDDACSAARRFSAANPSAAPAGAAGGGTATQR